VSSLPVVVNPVARGGRRAAPRELLERAAAGRGLHLEWWETERPGHAVELAARAARDRLPMLAVWGGDGTYNEAARGLVGSDTALVALPGGTTSVLAYELGVSRDPVQALLGQLDGARRAMAVAHTDRGERFLLMCSAGPDSVIMRNLPPALKLHAGKVGITIQAFVEFARGHLPRFDVTVNGDHREVSWCIVGNARCYGGPWAGTPGADPFSPGFETVVLKRHGRLAVVPFFFAIPSGAHLRMKGVERFTSQEVVLEGPEVIPYQLDGDPAGHLPVTVRSSAERLWVLVPRPPTVPID
jgi:diacylglycerol kinase (ATP)